MAVENGIIAGVGGSKPDPLGYANRAQLAQKMMNFAAVMEKYQFSNKKRK